MTDCPICDYPMVWSDDRERAWCSVYGDHRHAAIKKNVMRTAAQSEPPLQERPRPTRLSYE